LILIIGEQREENMKKNRKIDEKTGEKTGKTPTGQTKIETNRFRDRFKTNTQI
jgi:hypothetical protein